MMACGLSTISSITKKGENLKIVLFRLLQVCLAEGKVLSEHLTGQNPKYLDFFSSDYGFN